MVNYKTATILCFFALFLASCAGTSPFAGNGLRPADGSWGPGTSVPQIYMVDNGDRLGHYAPYFYPDGPPGRER
jgi:hypothetical protein